MGYPTQLSVSGNIEKRDLEYKASVLLDEINFDWSGIEFKCKHEPLIFPSATKVPLYG